MRRAFFRCANVDATNEGEYTVGKNERTKIASPPGRYAQASSKLWRPLVGDHYATQLGDLAAIDFALLPVRLIFIVLLVYFGTRFTTLGSIATGITIVVCLGIQIPFDRWIKVRRARIATEISVDLARFGIDGIGKPPLRKRSLFASWCTTNNVTAEQIRRASLNRP